MSYKQRLIDRLASREARVGIIGLGYVGLPLAIEFAAVGLNVIGLDVNQAKVDQINAGTSYIPDVPTERLKPLVETGKLCATTTYKDFATVDTINICVPTPLSKNRDPDMSYIITAVNAVSDVARKGILVILESTTYPGTTQEIICARLEADGFTVGEDIFIAFSPERIDPGNKTYMVQNTPKVVGGVTPNCTQVAQALYNTALETVVPVSSPTTAEMVKLLENTFRAVNIGLVNEVALMCDKLGVDAWEVISAAATKPFGFMPFYPGPGLGGHCIPVDPHYLSWKLKTLNYTARFIELASEINTSMPLYVLEKITNALNDDRKALRGSNVIVLGVAYKRDIDDVRESPALDIIGLLQQKGAEVQYHDPFIPSVRLQDERKMQSSVYTSALLSEADCVVIVTDHTTYDWQHVVDHSPVIVDTRHVVNGYQGRARVISL